MTDTPPAAPKEVAHGRVPQQIGSMGVAEKSSATNSAAAIERARRLQEEDHKLVTVIEQATIDGHPDMAGTQAAITWAVMQTREIFLTYAASECELLRQQYESVKHALRLENERAVSSEKALERMRAEEREQRELTEIAIKIVIGRATNVPWTEIPDSEVASWREAAARLRG